MKSKNIKIKNKVIELLEKKDMSVREIKDILSQEYNTRRHSFTLQQVIQILRCKEFEKVEDTKKPIIWRIKNEK